MIFLYKIKYILIYSALIHRIWIARKHFENTYVFIVNVT
jgi:hypothetical protein